MKQLLLLHGAIGASDQLLPLANLLKDNFDIHLLDFSGHGCGSDCTTFSIDQFSKDVLDYLQKKEIETIAIFGYSMGGYVALQLARQHPEKVELLFTLGTKFDWDPEIAAKEIQLLNPDRIEEKLPAFAHVLAQRHQTLNWKRVLKLTADMMTAMGNDNPLKPADSNEIKHRTRIVLGELDNMVTQKETQEVAEQLPNASLLILKNTSHPIEKVPLNELANEIIRFFGAHSSTL